MFWTTILAALLPAGVDILKDSAAAISRRIVGLSVDDEIKLKDADVARLTALAALDNPYGTPSQWIVDLRASFRYIAAAVLILAGIIIMGVGADQYLNPTEMVNADLAWAIILLGAETAGAPFSFIFGERMWTGLKGLRK